MTQIPAVMNLISRFKNNKYLKELEMIDRNQNFLGGVPKEAAAAAPTPSPHHGVSNPRFPWLAFTDALYTLTRVPGVYSTAC